MSISVNGQSKVPPGFRFHPTEEELLQYYLRKKVLYEEIDLDVIKDVDVNKLEPWDIRDKCNIGSTPQNDWYFFSHKDKKYPTGRRTNRATVAGFWKATGRDKIICSNSERVGMRKTLVFYTGRAPHGIKSDWIMYEYRLDDSISDTHNNVSFVMGETLQDEGWVVCRIFKKKTICKSLNNPLEFSSLSAATITPNLVNSNTEGNFEQVLQHMGPITEKKDEIKDMSHFEKPIEDTFIKLPSLESHSQTLDNGAFNEPMMGFGYLMDHDHDLEKLLLLSPSAYRSHLNTIQDYNGDIDLWSFAHLL